MKLSVIAILNIKGPDYRCIVGLISKDEAINLMQNADLTEKVNIIKHKNLLPHIKMGKEILTSGDNEIEKNKFYRNKAPISLKDVDTEKVLVSNKISFGEKSFKYFIGYLYGNHKVKPLHLIYPKSRSYVKSYNRQIKWMYFLTEDDDLLEQYNTNWDKVSADIKKNLSIIEPDYNKNFLKTKIKSHCDEVTDFYDK